MSKPKTRGKVEVVEFNEPCALDPVAKAKSKEKKSSSTKRPREVTNEEVQKNIKQAWDDVIEFGAAGLSKRDRKAYEEQKLIKLGCAPAKRPKIPMKILYSMKKTHEKRAKKLEQELKDADIITAKKSKNDKRKKGSKKRNDDVHHWKDGGMRGGILYVKEA